MFDDEIGVSFAYYSYQVDQLQDPAIVIGALLKQLCQKLDGIPPWLLQLFHNDLSPSAASNPESYIRIAGHFKAVFLVVDALDECPESKRDLVLDFVVKLTKALPCGKVFITSRYAMDIKVALEEIEAPVIKVETDLVSPDIEVFVNDEVRRLRGNKLHLKSDMLEQTIVRSLTERAEGMYADPEVHP